MRTNCANPKCGDDLIQPLRVNRGDKEAVRVGRFFCPACQYFGKRVFAAAVAITGVVCGLIWWVVNHI